MSKKGAGVLVAIIVILLAGLYVFFSPTGNVIYEPEAEGIFSTDIASCQAIDSSGLYVLTGDVAASENDSSCFSVSAENVTLDLAGFTVGAAVASVPGLVVDGVSGAVVKNGVVLANGTTVALVNNASATALNMTVVDTSVGAGSSLLTQWYVSVAVQDQDGAGVDGASVLVGDDSGTSDADGNVLASEVDGNYSVSASAEGYTNASSEAVVSGDNVAVVLSVNDTQAPVVNYTAYAAGVLNLTLDLDVAENGVLESCSAWYANGTDENDTVVEVLDNSTDGDSLYVGDLALGTTYEMHAGCVDTAGFAANSSLFNVTTLSEDPVEESSDDSSDDSDSGSSDDDDSSSSEGDSTSQPRARKDIQRAYAISADAFQKTGATKVLRTGDKMKFVLDKKAHFVSLKSMDNQSLVLEVLVETKVADSHPLVVGGIAQSDLDDDKVYDVFMLFKSVKGEDKAEIFIKSSNQPVPDEPAEAESVEETTEVQGGALTGRAVEEDVGTTSLATKIVAALLVLIVVVFWLIRRKNKGKNGLGKK